MHLGFIGLGRMGANMVRRLLRDQHQIVAYNRTPEKTQEIVGEGAEGAFSIAELVQKLEQPRTVWIMVPAGDATEAQIKELEMAMSAPGFYENREASKPVIDRHQALMWEVGDLMNQWEALQS